ncbi:unnamed protein product [Effrenium voratum]|nr:unnamed protein product [Effrenium voratum]
MSRSARHPKALQGDEALEATVEYIFKGLLSSSKLQKFLSESISQPLKEALHHFLSDSFDASFPGIRLGRDLLSDVALIGLQEVLLEAIEEEVGEDALVKAVRSLNSKFKEDARMKVLLGEIEDAAFSSSRIEEEEDDDDDENRVQFDSYNSFSNEQGRTMDVEEVITDRLEPLLLGQMVVMEVQSCWQSFLECYDRPEKAGEAIFANLLEAAPSLDKLFRGNDLIAGKFLHGISLMVANLENPANLTIIVENIGFQHLEVEVNIPRLAVFREALLDTVALQLGANLTDLGAQGLQRLLSYAGGAFIYLRENYAKRLKLIGSSWKIAAGTKEEEAAMEEEEEATTKEAVAQDESESDDEYEGLRVRQQTEEPKSRCARLCGRKETKQKKKKKQQEEASQMTQENLQAVPRTFEAMFRFNAAVMGVSRHEWMYQVLGSFDAMVHNISQSNALQVECNVVSLRIAKVHGEVKFSTFKAVMLSTLRAMLPTEWGPDYETAWNWLWRTIERLLSKELKKPKARERLLSRFLGSIEEQLLQKIHEQVYDRFFELAPAGQDYFKQSATRLNYIADQALEIALELYKAPMDTVERLSALGLRHVGYGVPVHLFEFFVEGWRITLQELTGDEELTDAFNWSFSLVSKLLVRTIEQGATVVMKAINTNCAKQVRRALAHAPRRKRAMWVLDVTVGSQSISPLLTAIESGNMEAAQAMLEDLVTIRADRSRYYYGLDELFKRHPDIVEHLTTHARELLITLLDGMTWRSRAVEGGERRVNYYLKHLLVDDNGNFAGALGSIVKLEDPEVAVHPMIATLCDMLWQDLVYWRFLQSKIRLLFLTLLFVISQSVLPNLDDRSDANRIGTFVCRSVIYTFSMVELLYTRTKIVYKAIKGGHLTNLGGVKLPRRWFESWQEAVSLLLTAVLIAMFFLEPIIMCLQSSDDGLLSSSCAQANDISQAYEILSMMALLLQFILLIDFTAISIKLSSWVLAAGQMLPDFALVLLACAFLILTFSSSVAAAVENPEDFQGLGPSLLNFFKLAVNVYPASRFVLLEENSVVLAAASCFRVLVLLFLMKILVAQLSCQYRRVYHSMVGHARLCRMRKICEAMASLHPTKFRAFVEHLRLDEPVQFGEGDAGLAGGIQVLEPANLHPTHVERIHRLGGNPKHPFPIEETDQTEAERCTRLFDLFRKAIKERIESESGSSANSGSSKASQSSNPRAESQEVSAFGEESFKSEPFRVPVSIWKRATSAREMLAATPSCSMISLGRLEAIFHADECWLVALDALGATIVNGRNVRCPDEFFDARSSTAEPLDQQVYRLGEQTEKVGMRERDGSASYLFFHPLPSQHVLQEKVGRKEEASVESEPERRPEEAKVPSKNTVEVGFKKAAQTKTVVKKRRPLTELLKVLRTNRCCLLALGLDDSAKDIAVLQALRRIPVEDVEMFFRDGGARGNVAKRIALLYEEAKAEVVEFSSGFLRQSRRYVVVGMLAFTACLLIAALATFLVSLNWLKGDCQFSDFTNGTCEHGNNCLLQVATWYENGIAYVNQFSPPVVPNDDGQSDIKIFEANGAFRCCNFAQVAAARDSIPEAPSTQNLGDLGAGVGSGTPCCNFYNSRFKVFCDNLGTVAQFSHCPITPWQCRLFLGEDERGRQIVAEARVWEEPWTVFLLACAGAMFGMLLIFQFLVFLSYYSERLAWLGSWLEIRLSRFGRWARVGRRFAGAKLRLQWLYRRALGMPTAAQEKALQREEKMREMALLIEARLREEEAQKMQGEEPEMFTLKRGVIKDIQERNRERKKQVAKELRKMFRESRKKRVDALHALETDGMEEDEGETSGDAMEDEPDPDLRTSQDFDPSEQIQPWDLTDLNSEEEKTSKAELNSRPVTHSLQSMLRPIMTPMQPQRRPKIASQKFGFQDPSSSTTSFVSDFGTTQSSLGNSALPPCIRAKDATDQFLQPWCLVVQS